MNDKIEILGGSSVYLSSVIQLFDGKRTNRRRLAQRNARLAVESK